ncbi:MAG: DUF4922 domain-containing protein [Prevotellaceae bacterium]|jgi:ATP adenylyltransferase/5',5'''-P-1,P-4-tetraphosphate phosphorylase II|nr:DUF4922 domain-containing protein [Prevotellaceae bacterium]
MRNLNKDINQLIESQLKEWDLARQNYANLSKVKTKTFSFGDFEIRVQFNPARIVSSAAKIDAKSIRERRCFLCPQNLPPEQRGIAFGRDYQILVNPFPIFPQHLTVPSLRHTGQLIFDRYGDMLDLAEALEDFVVFYNGPKCGASAPDHLHFQAGNKTFLPLEKDLQHIERKIIASKGTLLCYQLENYLRRVIVIESTEKQRVVEQFNTLYASLETRDGETEPMLNIVSWYGGGRWTSCIFPRKVHRPKCFFAEGGENLLISPASVDLGGVFILPQEKDFEKITKNDIKAVLEEVTL